MSEEGGVLSPKVHVTEQANAGGVAFEFLWRSDRPGRLARGNFELVVADNLIVNLFVDWLLCESQTNRDLISLFFAGRDVMNLVNQTHALWNHHRHARIEIHV